MKFLSVRDLKTKSSQVWKELPEQKEMVVTSNGRPIALLSSINENNLEQVLTAFRRARATNALASIQYDSIQKETDLSRKKSSVLVESLLEIIKQTLENGEDVLISGFGKFCVKEKNERKGRNPATGDDMMLAPRKVATFRCSPMLRIIIYS